MFPSARLRNGVYRYCGGQGQNPTHSLTHLVLDRAQIAICVLSWRIQQFTICYCLLS